MRDQRLTLCPACGQTRAAEGPCSSCVTEKVDITPSVNIFSLFERLNYKPWTALAEFVDNSLQSFLDHQARLSGARPPQSRVQVEIEFDEDADEIVVRDDAAGISIADFPRAFRIATPPPNPTGLNEFGMGMKCAAFWFSSRWRVRTHSLLDAACREVEFDRDRIKAERLSDLPVRLVGSAQGAGHGTTITLTGVGSRMPRTRTIQKVREFLADIYRVPLREGRLILIVEGEACEAQSPAFLDAPLCVKAGQASGPPLTWRKDFRIQLEGGRVIRGFAGILAEGKRGSAGFTLFRRGRVVDGFPGQRWMPERIFGARNSFESLRIFGELHLDGFSVSSQKDQIDWNDFEDAAIDLIRQEMERSPLPIIRQARLHRVTQESASDLPQALTEAAERTGRSLESATITDQSVAVGREDLRPQPKLSTEPEDLVARPRSYLVPVEGGDWRVEFSFVKRGDAGKWIDVRGASEDLQDEKGVRLLQISLLVSHPFMRNFVRGEPEHLEPVLRLAAALAIAERMARDAGVRVSATIRTRLNRILSDHLGHSMEDR